MDIPAQAAPPNRLPFNLSFQWLAALAIPVVYLLGILQHSFWGENEAYYSLGARSVMQGNWLLPYIYNDMLADKPPLVFWWVALVSTLAGGLTETTARLANIIPALGILYFLYRFGRTWAGPASALMGALVLATCYEFWENALEVNTDMLLGVSLMLCWSTIFMVFQRGLTPARWILIWTSMAVAMLTKGPVAPLLSAMLAAIFAFMSYGWRGGWQKLMSLRPFTGGIVCLLPFAIWAALVYHYKGMEPLRIILFQHNLQRFVDAFDHQKPWFYYIKELPVNLVPWSIALPFLIWRGYKARRAGATAEPWQRYAATAATIILVFFSLSSSKRDYYLLPLMPWVALLIGDGLVKTLARRDTTSSTTLPRSLAVTSAVFLVGLGVYFAVGLPMLEKIRSVKPLVSATENAVDEDDQLLVFAAEDPRIMYYLKERFRFYDDIPADQTAIKTVLATDPAGEYDILLPETALKRIKKLTTTPLFIEASGQFRDDKFYILSTEQKTSFKPLTDEYIQASRDKRAAERD